ncbi:MAG: hypothetical protein U5K51_05815 [Flavobacteriaceae bacterium]|nr:hypothetical protein [Flavobacteriaceae bacterium]
MILIGEIEVKNNGMHKMYYVGSPKIISSAHIEERKTKGLSPSLN